MRYFKNSNNEVFAFESDGSQDEFIDENLMEIMEKQAIEIANPPLSTTQLIIEAEQQKQHLLNESTVVITTFQDAINFNMATNDEIEKLDKWKIYRVLLNRIDTSTAPDITWPVKPE
nr:tail fiber assembly protein [Providencia rettgeri]